MNEDRYWYGYLEAGEKSSPVLLDNKLNTGEPRTVYLYNLKRGRILEYRREIVDPKLRDLKPEEASLVDEIKNGYAQAEPNLRLRAGASRHAIPEHGEQGAEKEEGSKEFAKAGISGGEDWDEEEEDES